MVGLSRDVDDNLRADLQPRSISRWTWRLAPRASRSPGPLESTGRPIVSPATGEQRRVRIDIPNGIEFEIAEIGSASTKATGLVGLELTDSYGQFNIVRHSGTGVVRTAA